MSHSITLLPELDRLRHRIQMLELENAEKKLKAKRMAAHAAYLEGLLKKAREAGYAR